MELIDEYKALEARYLQSLVVNNDLRDQIHTLKKENESLEKEVALQADALANLSNRVDGFKLKPGFNKGGFWIGHAVTFNRFEE